MTKTQNQRDLSIIKNGLKKINFKELGDMNIFAAKKSDVEKELNILTKDRYNQIILDKVNNDYHSFTSAIIDTNQELDLTLDESKKLLSPTIKEELQNEAIFNKTLKLAKFRTTKLW